MTAYAEEITELADGADSKDSAGVKKARLQVDARKWVMSKLAPKVYGDKLALDGGEPLKVEHVIEQAIVRPKDKKDE